ncbi:MAG: hypothetical protein CMC87_00895 [Flavobacteriaceae bacterium]|nr:hypothetical protein [Flavobacteriaceae bacterium]
MSISLSSVYAQVTSIPALQYTYTNYFQLNREYVHLHLNKTKIAPKENIWFSAYVYDLRTNLPNATTTNLNVALFNEDGQQIDYKTIFINHGFGNGYFNLSEKKLSPGSYYIQASTNYMNNFREDLTFSENFQLLGNLQEKSNEKENIKYDLQFLPESGHLLANVSNNVGVKLIDQNGKGVFFYDAQVLNSNKEKINSFKSNKFGISKFIINPKVSETYKIQLKTEYGDTILQSLPKPEPKGLILKANNFLTDQLALCLETNEESLSKISHKNFFLTITQNQNIKGIQLNFNHSTTYNTIIKREDLFPGINIITVFNENFQPILERLIFNPINIKRKSVTAEISDNLIDSLVIKIHSQEKIDSLQRISISTLPTNNKSYTPSHNILSSFFLKPYISSTIEEGSYYFTDANERKRLFDLDLLLLTQGWSSYNWKNIFNFKPTENFQNEIGFTLSGKLLDDSKSEHRLFITSKTSNLLEILELKDSTNFSLNHLFLKDSSKVYLGLFNKNLNKIKKSSYALSVLPFKKESSFYNSKKTIVNTNQDKFLPIDFKTFIQSTEALDTVVIKAKKKQEIDHRHSGFSDVTLVDEQMATQYHYITDYIANQNFEVRRTMGDVIIKSRRAATINGSRQTRVILDGVPLEGNTVMIYNLLTSQVESISINKSGIGYGVFGGNGVIEIITKTDYKNAKSKNKNFFEYITNNGFSKNKKFYQPKYSSYNTNLFKKYGVIDWQPSITLDKINPEITFKIPNTLTENTTLYIEGMSADGYLISEEIILHLKQ